MAVKKLYFAPMEGVAGYIFRNIYADFFDDADKFFSPFVVTRPSGIMKNKELRDILPENNEKLFLVPQILANNADGFINASKQMRELGGYYSKFKSAFLFRVDPTEQVKELFA